MKFNISVVYNSYVTNVGGFKSFIEAYEYMIEMDELFKDQAGFKEVKITKY